MPGRLVSYVILMGLETLSAKPPSAGPAHSRLPPIQPMRSTLSTLCFLEEEAQITFLIYLESFILSLSHLEALMIS